jgi:hypothetical protein
VGDEFDRADWTPASDIYETETGYLIAIDLPGIDRQKVEIDMVDNRLTVRGTRLVEESTKQRTERPGGKFLRTFTVPPSVDQAQIGGGLPRRNAANQIAEAQGTEVEKSGDQDHLSNVSEGQGRRNDQKSKRDEDVQSELRVTDHVVFI